MINTREEIMVSTFPNGWLRSRIKYLVYINQKTLPETTAKDYEIRYIDIGNVDSDGQIVSMDGYVFSDAPRRARRIVSEGDTIVSTVRTYLKAIAYIDEKKSNSVCSTGFAVLTPKKDIYHKYLYYLLRSDIYVQEIVKRSIGVSYPAINALEIANLPLYFPEYEKQKIIVNHLDSKIVDINHIINDKQIQIKLLQEKRLAIIHQAVTKGLDNAASLKDSGVEWVGQIPEKWKIMRIKNISKGIFTGTTPTTLKEDYFDGDINWFTPADFKENLELIESKRKIDISAIEAGEARLFPSNLVVIVGIGATLGKVGITVNKCSFNQQITGMLCNHEIILPKYLLYWMHANAEIIKAMTNYTTLPILNNQEIKRITIILPPLEKQREIVNFIDKYNKITNRLIKDIITQIAKLKEYCQSLIHEAVTGKIKIT